MVYALDSGIGDPGSIPARSVTSSQTMFIKGAPGDAQTLSIIRWKIATKPRDIKLIWCCHNIMITPEQWMKMRLAVNEWSTILLPIKVALFRCLAVINLHEIRSYSEISGTIICSVWVTWSPCLCGNVFRQYGNMIFLAMHVANWL